jgi:hypothetical protein
VPKYQTNFQINTVDGSEQIEIRNPSASGKNLELVKISIVAETGFAVYDLQRYTALATHAVGPDPEPTQADVFKWDPSDASPVGEVWYGAAATITFGGTLDFHHDVQLDASDAGDDAEVIFGKYLYGENVVMVPGTSARWELPQDAQSSYTIQIIWQEVGV